MEERASVFGKTTKRASVKIKNALLRSLDEVVSAAPILFSIPDEHLSKLFFLYARMETINGNAILILRPVQFITIWRQVVDNNGNLFEEMKIVSMYELMISLHFVFNFSFTYLGLILKEKDTWK